MRRKPRYRFVRVNKLLGSRAVSRGCRFKDPTMPKIAMRIPMLVVTE
jgi:hypothetical protein